MSKYTRRRSRTVTVDDEDEDESRPGTPASTAPNDSKRARRNTRQVDDHDESQSSEDETLQQSTTPASELLKKSKSPIVNGSTTASAKHQPGAIIRVKLTNFVTYTSAEFFPGPNLNMVIGPNGTGKSTLVCAICLGLGWGPQYLGRAKDAAEFVKHGSREATIEIELQRKTSGSNATRRNPIITRTIRREGNKSTYLLNGNSTSGKNVQSLAQSYDIQIDNLCQFLPQDKVVEFAQMTPIEILQSTQRATSSSEMLVMHEDLKKLRDRQRALMGDERQDRERLANYQGRQEMQRTEVERMRERAAVQKRLTWLEKCRPISQYYAAKEKAETEKAKQQQLSEEVNKLEKESGPTLAKVNAKQKYEVSVKALKERRQKEVEGSEKECDRIHREIESCNDAITDLTNSLEGEKKSIQPKREELKRTQQRVALLRNQKTNRPEEFDSRAMNQEIQDRTNQKREVETQATDLTAKRRDLIKQGQDRKEQIVELRKQIDSLETQSGQQANKLEQVSRDTFRAWKWIEDNRDQFEQHVFGPPMIECSLKNPKMADAIESLLQGSDFKIITVQNYHDFSLLQNKLNKVMKLHDVSIRTCDKTSLENFRPPLSPEEMKTNGIESWAIDQFNGPPTVLAMLCIEKNLHQCGIAARDVNQEQHEALANGPVRSYVAGGKCYQFVRRTEYGASNSFARVRDVRPARVWTNQPVDFGRKAALERDVSEKKDEISTLKAEEEQCKATIGELRQDYESLQKEIDEIKQDKDRKQKALVEWNALDTKIEQAKEKEETLRESIETIKTRLIEILSERDNRLLEKAEAVIRFAAATDALREKIQHHLKIEVMHIEANSDYETLAANNQQLTNMIAKMQDALTEATRIARFERERAKELGKTCRKLSAEGRALNEEGEPGLADLLHDIIERKISEEDLDTEITSEKARLELTEGGNANAIKEFEERAKHIEELQSRLSKSRNQQDEFKFAINDIRSQWEPQLDAVVRKISDAFSDSFSRIGCAGQVVVHKASSDDLADCTDDQGGRENGLDFANWAIHISVKFRENEPLSLLDSHRQSGGERAVSTIFYLMAMQSLSRAPFRVVDEINQGMDPRNERMVHGRMVDIASDDGGSQYFLITPKLLSGLKYRRGMTVLCIVSGENMPPSHIKGDDGRVVENQKVDFRQFVDKARLLGLGKAMTTRESSADTGSGGIVGNDYGINGHGHGLGTRVAEVGA